MYPFKPLPEQVLRPYTNVSSLRVWDYYVEENLYGGPSFDRELFEAATNEDNEQPLEQSDRRTVNASYDDVAHAELDIHRWLLEVCLFVCLYAGWLECILYDRILEGKSYIVNFKEGYVKTFMCPLEKKGEKERQ